MKEKKSLILYGYAPKYKAVIIMAYTTETKKRRALGSCKKAESNTSRQYKRMIIESARTAKKSLVKMKAETRMQTESRVIMCL
jgi:hypothetical protein